MSVILQSEQQIAGAAELWENGSTYRQIGSRFDMTMSAVAYMVRRHRHRFPRRRTPSDDVIALPTEARSSAPFPTYVRQVKTSGFEAQHGPGFVCVTLRATSIEMGA